MFNEDIGTLDVKWILWDGLYESERRFILLELYCVRVRGCSVFVRVEILSSSVL